MSFDFLTEIMLHTLRKKSDHDFQKIMKLVKDLIRKEGITEVQLWESVMGLGIIMSPDSTTTHGLLANALISIGRMELEQEASKSDDKGTENA